MAAGYEAVASRDNQQAPAQEEAEEEEKAEQDELVSGSEAAELGGCSSDTIKAHRGAAAWEAAAVAGEETASPARSEGSTQQVRPLPLLLLLKLGLLLTLLLLLTAWLSLSFSLETAAHHPSPPLRTLPHHLSSSPVVTPTFPLFL